MQRSRPFVCLAVLILAGLAGGTRAFQAERPSPEVDPEVKQRYAYAQRLLAAGETEKALQELRAIAELAPQFVAAQLDLIDNQNDKAALIVVYERKVQESPNRALWHYLLGKALVKTGKGERADEEFQKAVDLDPGFGWALLALVDAADRKGEAARAADLLDRASKAAGPSARLHALIAEQFLNDRNDARALTESERSLGLEPAYYYAYPTKWRAQMNLASGSDRARLEVSREVGVLESAHGKDVDALWAAFKGYHILDDEKGAERAMRAVLSLDPRFFQRKESTLMDQALSGQLIPVTGATFRQLARAGSIKDPRERLAAFNKLETDLADERAKLYLLYPDILQAYVALKEMGGADRTLALLEKARVDTLELAHLRIILARGYIESRLNLDVALRNLDRAVDELRERLAAAAQAKPNAHLKSPLAQALVLRGRILLEEGLTDQAAAALDQAVQLSETEDGLLDLGLAYAKLGKTAEAINARLRAYGLGGSRQQEAKAELEKVYPSSGDPEPLTARLAQAVERRREQLRRLALDAAIAELSETPPAPAPAFALATLAGQRVQLSDLRGKVVLLNFWATW